MGLTLVLFLLFPLVNHAGGLGISAICALVGIAGLVSVPWLKIERVPEWVWAMALFLGWVLLTSLWSPYEDMRDMPNPVKVGLGGVLYTSMLLVVQSATTMNSRLLRHFFLAMMVLSVGLLLIDLLTGYGLTYLIDPLKEGEDATRKRGSTEMNLGHAVAVLTLLLMPAMVILSREIRMGWVAALAFAAALGLAALLSGLSAGLLAMIAAFVAAALAYMKPVLALRLMTWGAILSILLAPLVGYALDYMGPETKAALPFSWEHRAEMWAFTAQEIFKAPLWGQGFDAVRTFDATMQLKGHEWAIVSLHPHNAGLHIWVETGLIGAALAALTVLAMGTAAETFIQGSRGRAIALCGFMAASIVICSTTFGVWQEWWWATQFFVVSTLWLIGRDTNGAT